jgi:hypothetical protein
MKEFYSGERILLKKPVYYKTDEQPELWFAAEQIWEILGAGNVKPLLLTFYLGNSFAWKRASTFPVLFWAFEIH